MADKKEFTELFFSWAKSKRLKTSDIAKELGKNPVVVSNWRGKGLPPNHEYACRAYMSKVAILEALNQGGSE